MADRANPTILLFQSGDINSVDTNLSTNLPLADENMYVIKSEMRGTF